MKKPIFLLLAGAMLAGAGNVAHAQRDRPSREDRRENFRQQLQNMTPQQQMQFFQNRFDEVMKSATPEQRERMQNMRAAIEKRIKDANIDPNDPNFMQKVQQAMQGMDFRGMAGGANGQGGNGGGGRAERAAADAMRAMMEAAGISDFDIQDAIIAYVAEQNKARATLFQLAQTAAAALQAPVVLPVNTDGAATAEKTADAKVATTFSAYETAVKAENERQEKALKELDAKINYSGTPRIKAFLTLVGILDNDVLALGGPAAVFPSNNRGGGRQMDMNGGQNGMMQDGETQGGGRGGRGGRGNWNRGN